ncbi:hypothetical protein AB0K71_05980 [Streptomyces syringium]|uniref:hypothetical protein n=1 Tax=Streptomyces syringium TaxID=76729 RepID=UPI003442E7B9
MNHLVEITTHSEPSDYRGPFEPVRAAIRRGARNTPCHRCDNADIPDLVHLADANGSHLCPDCTRLVNPALRRGLQALNQLAHAINQPDAHPAVLLVRDWRSALTMARPGEAHLLRTAAQLLATHVGYRPPGFTAHEIAGR